MIFNKLIDDVKTSFGIKHPCKFCSILTNEVLVVDEKNNIREYYCRNHLISKFSQYFNQYHYKMVVFYPELERRYCGTQYPYYPITEFEKYEFAKEDVETISNILRLICTKCQQCDKENVNIAYFKKGILTYSGYGPNLVDVKAHPEILCNNCCLKNIINELINNKESFCDNGLFCPYNGEGVYVNTFL